MPYSSVVAAFLLFVCLQGMAGMGIMVADAWAVAAGVRRVGVWGRYSGAVYGQRRQKP